MKISLKIIPLLAILAASGCTRPLAIGPDLAEFDRTNIKQSRAVVGYFISDADRNREVVTPGGGGDKVKYKPYGQLEPVIQKVLSNKFKRVYSMASANDQALIREKNISFIFIPKITTDSSSSSALTWPPTDFTIELECRAVSKSGTTIWKKNIVGKGKATFGEFKRNFSLSAQRASLNTFKMFEKALDKEKRFR